MSERPDNLERLIELLSDRVTGPLTQAESQELDELIRVTPGALSIAASFDQVEGGLVGAVHASGEALPESLRERVIVDFRAHVQASSEDAPRPIAFPPATGRAEPAGRGSPLGVNLRWLAAAAALAMAAIVWWSWRPSPAAPLTLEEARAALVAKATDLTTLSLDPANGFEGVVAEVVWSDAHQQGFLRIRGLPASSDPARHHVWITDGTRADEMPVLAAVFDAGAQRIDPVSGEAIIALKPGSPIGRAVGFAVSLDSEGAQRPGQIVLRGVA